MIPEPNRLSLLPRELGPLTFVADLKPLPLIGPTEAARFLDVARHTLACYRCLDDGPAYYKFGRWIRYAPDDLRYWRDGPTASRRRTRAEPETGEMRLVTPALAARFLTVTLPCLCSYRVDGVGPKYLRYANRIYYPVHELRAWAESRRHAAGGNVRRASQTSRKRRA